MLTLCRHLVLCGVLIFFSGCETMQVPLSTVERKGGLCQQDPVVTEKLSRLQAGMCEQEVFDILGISHETPNLGSLDTLTLFEHVSLLSERSKPSNVCSTSHDSEVPYVGHRVPCTRLNRRGYLEGIQWVQRTIGEDSYVDLLFKDGSFISFSKGGIINKDSKESAYPWQSILSDPFSELGDTVR